MATPDAVERCYREFLDIMPLTLEIAGLKPCDANRSFTQEQMEARAKVIQAAFDVARRAVRESIANG